MKKTTNILTAFATAVALILGASAFVSCSNSSDDSTPAYTAEEKAFMDAMERAEEMEAKYGKITVEKVKAALEAADDDTEYGDLSSEAAAYNTTFETQAALVFAAVEKALELVDADDEPTQDEIKAAAVTLNTVLDTAETAIEAVYDALSPAEKVAANTPDAKEPEGGESEPTPEESTQD